MTIPFSLPFLLSLVEVGPPRPMIPALLLAPLLGTLMGVTIAEATSERLVCLVQGVKIVKDRRTFRPDAPKIVWEVTLTPDSLTINEAGVPSRSYQCNRVKGAQVCFRDGSEATYFRERYVLARQDTFPGGLTVSAVAECEPR